MAQITNREQTNPNGSPLLTTDDQLRALRRKFAQSADGSPDFDHFKARAQNDSLMDCVMIHWCGMWLGIETDGYTHS